MRGNRPLAFGGVLGSCLVGFCLVLGLLCSLPPHHAVFPSPSMMAWALRPHGVRTRGKRNCDKLQTVDISRTEINEILGGTFARCSQLQHLKFAKTLRRIEREAFLRCTSLEEIHTPPRMGKKGTWRGTYAEHDAFETCTKLALPTWIRFLPTRNAVKEEWEDFMRSCADANLSAAAHR